MGQRIRLLTVWLWEHMSEDSEQRKKCWEQFGRASRMMGRSGSRGQWTSEIKPEREQNPDDQSHFILLPFLLFNGVQMA